MKLPWASGYAPVIRGCFLRRLQKLRHFRKARAVAVTRRYPSDTMKLHDIRYGRKCPVKSARTVHIEPGINATFRLSRPSAALQNKLIIFRLYKKGPLRWMLSSGSKR